MIAIVFLLLPILPITLYVGLVTQEVDQKIAQLRGAKSTSFLIEIPKWTADTRLKPDALEETLTLLGYVQGQALQNLVPGEYIRERSGNDVRLTLYRPEYQGPGGPLDQARLRIQLRWENGVWKVDEMIRVDANGVTLGDSLPELVHAPRKIASYVAGRMRTQDAAPLSEIPVNMRHAVMAIEDVHFLEHSGVSFRGTLRAILKDLRAGGFVEGGSTITQQLMKNLFFTKEKALTRKIKEAIFAFVTEARHSKEDILEAYLNEVYMGQAGAQEIHGVPEGANFFFNRPVSLLTLGQCATLAAIVQAPNSHDPRRHPEKTLRRRNLVLNKMLEAGFILPEEYASAVADPLGVVSADRTANDVSYFVDTIVQSLSPSLARRLEFDALSIFATVNPAFQRSAMRAVSANAERLKSFSPAVKAREDQGFPLQAALIAIDVPTCQVRAIQGGRRYSTTQFNRITQAKRQAGSLFKPFVFLTAFMNDPELRPETMIEDAPFEWEYDRKTWAPKNYEKEFLGEVSVRHALEASINIPTAKLAQKTGLRKIRDTLVSAGIQTPLPEIPSLSLGGVDVSPWEVAQAYTTLAGLGNRCRLSTYSKIYDEHGNLLETETTSFTQALPRVPTFETVHLLQGALSHGTGRSAPAHGFQGKGFAGKTGTTNEGRDAWFVGFSPEIVVLAWVGYDEKHAMGLTGATAALPLWAGFMKDVQGSLLGKEFEVPGELGSYYTDRADPKNTGTCKESQLEYAAGGAKASCHPQ